MSGDVDIAFLSRLQRFFQLLRVFQLAGKFGDAVEEEILAVFVLPPNAGRTQPNTSSSG